jgi:hypothetical protein
LLLFEVDQVSLILFILVAYINMLCAWCYESFISWLCFLLISICLVLVAGTAIFE